MSIPIHRKVDVVFAITFLVLSSSVFSMACYGNEYVVACLWFLAGIIGYLLSTINGSTKEAAFTVGVLIIITALGVYLRHGDFKTYLAVSGMTSLFFIFGILFDHLPLHPNRIGNDGPRYR